MKNISCVLRDYQLEMKDRLFDEWSRNCSVMAQMPTGTGKTHLLAEIVRTFLKAHGAQTQVWIVAHRRELVAQIEDTMAGYGIRKGNKRVKAMSIQWLGRHWGDVEGQPVLIVIDEAHHALADTYIELWKRYPEARKLGMTATPCRLNGKGFTNLFDKLIISWSIADFIRKGWLSVFDYVSIRSHGEEQLLINSLVKRGADGDYQVKEMNEVLNRPPAIERLYQSMRQYADGKKGIVYAVSIEHARAIAAYYSGQGVCSVAIDSRTPAAERKQMVEAFRRGEIKVMVNVDVFSEGFDCPDVEFVQMARPTLSLAKYLQQVGRGLRRSAGKVACVLIDNVGLYRVFGLPTVEWDWEAMFEGRLSGKGQPEPESRTVRYAIDTDTSVREMKDESLEVVVTHDHLLAFLLQEKMHGDKKLKEPLKAFKDRRTGLWGLKRGNLVTAVPRFLQVFGVEGTRAAVKLENGTGAVVDGSGTVAERFGKVDGMRFMKDDLLMVTAQAGRGPAESYVDLRNGRVYSRRPVVVRLGNVELLKVGAVYYSRTRKVSEFDDWYTEDRGVWMGFYLKIDDYRAVSPTFSVGKDGRILDEVCRCILEDDEDEVYDFCCSLPDRSIVVRAADGRYYRVEKGMPKQYVAADLCGIAGEDPQTVVERLRAEAILREKADRQERLRDEAFKRMERLTQLREAMPFKSGLKWGLRLPDGQVVVPPLYRKIGKPVGYFCAFEAGSCQWGIMALDGRIVVEAHYREVRIDQDGTACLTVVPGKIRTVKLEVV